MSSEISCICHKYIVVCIMYIMFHLFILCSQYFLGGWTSAADLHGMWYPPVRRTLMCLSRLYRCVDKTIFQSLSHEAVALCLKNIHQAALIISQRKVNRNYFMYLILFIFNSYMFY